MKKRKTLGKMTNTRAQWEINPVTRIVKDKKKYDRKEKHKIKFDKDNY